MNQKRQQVLLLITVLLLTGVLGWLAWQGVWLIREQRGTRENLMATHLIEQTHFFLKTLNQEQRQSAVYMAEKNRNDLLTQQRKKTDQSMQDLIVLVQKNVALENAAERIYHLPESMGLIRAKVDAISSSNGRIFYEGFYQQVVQTLIQAIRKNRILFSPQDMDGLLRYALKIDQLYATGMLEKNFLHYAMLSSPDAREKQLVIWERIINAITLPKFSGINDVALLQQIHELVENSISEKALNGIRFDYVMSLADPRHQPDEAALQSTYADKLNALDKANTLLIERYRKDLIQRDTSVKKEIWVYGAGALTVLILLITLLWVYRGIHRENQLLEETLKDIEFELDKEKKIELLRIIEQGDTQQTYTFFAETIKESNRAKDLFLANMSHEIRTPLNGIMGFTQLLKSGTTDAEREEYIHVIEESSEMLLTIVNDILDLSKIKADKIELEEIAFDPLDKIESAVEAMGAKALLKEIEFGVYVDPRLPVEIMGDPTRLSQVLVNLIGNAIKFTPTHGQISLSCEQVTNSGEEVVVRFSVQDTGIGISEKQQEKIFEAFSQADVSTTRQYGGTGLGLSISSKLVSLMGGKLELDSIEGEGSIFYFTLAFKKGSNDSFREVHHFEGIQAGLLLPKRDIDRPVDRNLNQFLRYMGVDASFFYEDEIYTLDQAALPDLLFVDQRYSQREGEIEKILSLETRIVLIASGNLSKKINELHDQFQDIVHKPINYSKIEKILLSNAGQAEEKKDTLQKVSRFDDLYILVAEDNIINQKLIRSTLENFGIHVTIASNGEEAVSLRKQNSYDLIFMDIQMPVMNGMEATEQILDYEKTHEFAHVPIVALTANALKGDREKYLRSGMDDYTPKPLKIDLIKEIIRHYCPEKEYFVEQENLEVLSAESEEEVPEVFVEKKHILLYFTNALIRSIHVHMLDAIAECTLVESEAELLERLESREYSAVLLDSVLLPQDHCYFADLLEDKKISIHVFGEKDWVACPSIEVYETIRNVRERLREEG